MEQAERGIDTLKECVDALVVIPNDKLLEISDNKTSMQSAFKMADDVLGQSVKGISDLITHPGFINLDFADIKSVMGNSGIVHMGIGRASGENRAETAAKLAINSPLLETTIDGATQAMVNIAGSNDITLFEVNAAMDLIYQLVDKDANIIFGTSIDDNLRDEVVVTVVATGCEEGKRSVGGDLDKITFSDEAVTKFGEGDINIPAFLKGQEN